MIIGEQKQKEFNEKCAPLMDWLADNFHPHVHIVLDSHRAEISEGFCATIRNRDPETRTDIITEDDTGRCV